MKKHLMAGAAALAFFAVSGAAHAQGVPVYDNLMNIQTMANGAKEAASWAKQVADMYRQYQQDVELYQQTVNEVNALAHTTDMSGMANQLGLGSSYLPDAQAVTGLMQGSGAWGQAATFANRMTAYSSPQQDRVTQEMDRRTAVTANAQAFATASNADIQQHIQNLTALQARLSAAKDVTEVDTVNGLIALEQQQLDAYRSGLQNVALLLSADDRAIQQRQEQVQRRNADELVAATAPFQATLQ